MYLLKNAWRNVIRSKGRNILIGVIVFVISISACVSLSIRQAAEREKATGMDDVEITAQITVDRQSMMQSMGEEGADHSQIKEKIKDIDGLSIEELKKYAESSTVKNFYYTLTASLDGSNIEEVSSSSSDSGESDMGIGPENNNKGNMGSQGAFSLVGYSSEDAMTDFVSGTCKITDGEMFEEGTSNKTCVISDELATYNSIEVGDTIKLENPGNAKETMKLKVVGIYNNSSSTSMQDGVMTRFQSMSDPANQILLSYEALKAITDDMNSVFSQTNGTYVFADKEKFEQFQEDVKEMGLDDSYTVSSQDVNDYEQSLIPLENLSKFATYFFIVVLVIGAVVLMVIHIFNIRERKYEIGVLTAIGMRKWKVCTQFIMEIFFVTILAMIIGLAAGSVASVPVSGKLLEYQIESQQQQISNQEMNFGRGGNMQQDHSISDSESKNTNGIQSAPSSEKNGFMNRTADYMSDISASVNLIVVLQIFAVGILLTVISGFVAIISVIRYEPLQILSSRS